ncbi:hypothetical protein IFM89_004863 [Coptis chinensis]|uniref:LisH domain-containing protein n=1 Tax=Coptis chinensis TaxID=261450 RepID=A0A835I9Y0_9MAGN|nr:hypothetical protein IFM89_004863 [Coptis chinensis]
MSQTNWEADKMLDVYIYDYLVKRNLQASAKAFQAEGKVSSDPVAIDAPGGFLFEWWSVFWDIFIARTNEKHSEVAASYIETPNVVVDIESFNGNVDFKMWKSLTQQIKAREQQQQQPQQQQPQHMQMHQLLLQRHAQQQQQQQEQQRREGAHLINGTANGLVSSDPLQRQNPSTANALAAKRYEEELKLPHQRDPLDDTAMKNFLLQQRFRDNVGQLLDPNHASVLKSAAVTSQSSGQILHGTAGGMSGALQQVQARSQQLAGSSQDIKGKMNPLLNPRAAGPDGSLIGVPGINC